MNAVSAVGNAVRFLLYHFYPSYLCLFLLIFLQSARVDD
ncbi:Uncharacterised protein [Segatella copri]|nr:Uncharacterised protein [Segatella copri]